MTGTSEADLRRAVAVAGSADSGLRQPIACSALFGQHAGPSASLGQSCGALLAILLAALLGPAPARPQALEGGDPQIQAHLNAAKQAEAAKDYLEAAKLYEAILALRPGWALIHQSLGVTYHLAKLYPQAIEQLQEAVRLDEQLWGAYLFLGMDYYQTHRFAKALQALKKSLALNPELAETKRWLGLTHAALRQYEEAISYLKEVADGETGGAEAWFHLARAYDRRAEQLFEAIGDRDPDSPFVYLLHAERLAAEGNHPRALAEEARAVELRPDLAGVLDSLAAAPRLPAPSRQGFAASQSAFREGRFDAVIQDAKRMLAATPEEAEAAYWLGRSYKKLAGRALQRLTVVAPDSHRVHQLAAEYHETRTEYGQAIEAYRRALTKRPQLPGLRYAIGNAFWKMGRFAEAEGWLRKELEANPHHALASHRLGAILLEQGKATDSVPLLERTVAANPAQMEARLDLGRAYLACKRFVEAAETLEAYARAFPSSDRAHYLLANAYRGLGRIKDAQRELQLYQESSRRRLRRVQEDVRSVADDIDNAPR